jgi:hypothetical protein
MLSCEGDTHAGDVSIGAGDPSASFPTACNDSELTEQEKVLTFMQFDLLVHHARRPAGVAKRPARPARPDGRQAW